MNVYDAGRKAFQEGEGTDANPHAGNAARAWLDRQWALGWHDGHANAVEAADDARIEAWEDDRDWASGRC